MMTQVSHCNWNQNKGDDPLNGDACMRNGKRQGKWKLHFTNGSICTGAYVDGERHGEWELRRADGVVASGRFEEDKPIGIWAYQLPVDGTDREFRVHYVSGPWKAGLVLDYHMVPDTDNRTYLGEQMYQFKYQDSSAAGRNLTTCAVALLERHRFDFNAVVAVPSSTGEWKNKTAVLARELAEKLHVTYVNDALNTIKPTTDGLKDADRDIDIRKSIINGVFGASKGALAGKSVLLVDDLYTTGATLGTVSEIAYKVARAKAVRVFAFTKTKPGHVAPGPVSITTDDDLPF